MRGIHERVRGHDPKGRPYRAGDPRLLRWVHVAEVDSFLTAHQRYAVEPLTASEADTYVAQSALVAGRLGATDLPTTVAELGDALDGLPARARGDRRGPGGRPVPAARPARCRWAARPGYGLIASGGVALLPRWARRALRLPAGGPVTALAGGAGHVGTRAVRWAMAGVAQERQLAAGS